MGGAAADPFLDRREKLLLADLAEGNGSERVPGRNYGMFFWLFGL
jgi:hypothetical protein